MKKTKLGKITFLLVCLLTFTFVFVKAYTIWNACDIFGGWKGLMDALSELYVSAAIKFICYIIIIPAIWSLVYLMYVYKIAIGENIKRTVFVITALVIVGEMAVLVSRNYYDDSIASFIEVGSRIGFIIAFVLLTVGISKTPIRNILYVILGFSCICAAVYMVIYFKNNFGDILHIIESEKGVTVFALCGECYVLPVLKLLASILIMGYIVVPSKYIEYAEE